MTISASMHGDDERAMRRAGGWAGLSGTAGFRRPDPAPAARGPARARPDRRPTRHRDHRLRAGPARRHRALLRVRRGRHLRWPGPQARRPARPAPQRAAATRVTIAALLVGGTALGSSARSSDRRTPRSTTPPAVGPDGTPVSVAPTPGAPGSPASPASPVTRHPADRCLHHLGREPRPASRRPRRCPRGHRRHVVAPRRDRPRPRGTRPGVRGGRRRHHTTPGAGAAASPW